MKIKIFYSWQSDLPNNTNRNFIKTALDNIAKLITGNVESADREIEIDTATKGIVGAVNIADRILRKIDECDIFVADVSIIGKVDPINKSEVKGKLRRRTPNPNVLFELGYAWKTLGEEKIILVMNTAYGKFEDLPFDLRGKTMIPYLISKDDEIKVSERKTLETVLNEAVVSIISNKTQDNNEESVSGSVQNPVESPSISPAERIRRRFEHQQFRQVWLESTEGVENARNSVENIFDAMEEIYDKERDAYQSMGITSHRQKISLSPHFWLHFANNLYLRLSWSTYFGNSLDKARLYFVLSPHKNFDDLIIEGRYMPDINEDRDVVWYKDNVPNHKLPSFGLAQMFFSTFMNHLEDIVSKFK